LRRAWAAAVLVLLSPACASGDAAVRVMVSGDPAELEAYRSLVDAYEAAGGGDVRLIEVADRDELVLRLSTSIASGDEPDLVLINYRNYPQFQATGALTPMNDLLEGSTALRADGFFPAALGAFRDAGVQTCLPQNAASLVLYYNANLFEAAGLQTPPDDWSWNAMVRAAESLTTDADGDGSVDVYGLGVSPELIRVAPFLWSNGAELVDDEGSPSRFAFDTVEGVTALQGFLDLRGIDEVTPTDEESESEDLEQRFLNGRLAMLMESRKVVPTFRTITSFDWDVAALPRMGREQVSILHSDGYCLLAGADHPADAWRFVEFALGPEGQRLTAAAGRTVPSLVSVANSKVFLDPAAEPSNGQAYLGQLANARAVPTVSTWPEIEDAVNAILEEAFYEPGGAEANEVATQIVTVTESLFERAEP
jgi:multiple sugar transport system substrate-binding protein